VADLWRSLDAWDREAFLWLHGRLHAIRGGGFHDLLRFADAFGNGWQAAFLAIAALLLSRRWLGRLLRVADVAVVHLAVGLVLPWLKHTIGRPRPARALAEAFADGRASFAFGEHGMNTGFPSGHAGTVFASATLLVLWAAESGGWRRALPVGIAAYALAILTCLARVYAGMHFPLDVAAGALLGALVALLLVVGRTRLLHLRVPRPVPA
jgi:undecaprenyl-diphosphatase